MYLAIFCSRAVIGPYMILLWFLISPGASRFPRSPSYRTNRSQGGIIVVPILPGITDVGSIGWGVTDGRKGGYHTPQGRCLVAPDGSVRSVLRVDAAGRVQFFRVDVTHPEH